MVASAATARVSAPWAPSQRRRGPARMASGAAASASVTAEAMIVPASSLDNPTSRASKLFTGGTGGTLGNTIWAHLANSRCPVARGWVVDSRCSLSWLSPSRQTLRVRSGGARHRLSVKQPSNKLWGHVSSVHAGQQGQPMPNRLPWRSVVKQSSSNQLIHVCGAKRLTLPPQSSNHQTKMTADTWHNHWSRRCGRFGGNGERLLSQTTVKQVQVFHCWRPKTECIADFGNRPRDRG